MKQPRKKASKKTSRKTSKKTSKKASRIARAQPRPRKSIAAANPDLEAQIARSPDDPAPYQVYADWLQQAGDPRGELAAIQSARLDARGPELARLLIAEQELLEAHAKHFYGPLTRFRRARQTQLEWFCGFVCALDGGSSMDAAAFLDHPSARCVQRLSLIDAPLDQATAPPLLSHLTTSQTDLAWVWAAAPRLRELRVAAWEEADLGAPRHDALTLLHVHGASDALLDVLAGAALPRLKTLSLSGLRARQAARVLPAVEGCAPAAELLLGLSPGFDDGAYDDLADAAPRVTTLLLDRLAAPSLLGLRALDWSGVTTLDVQAASGDVRETMFDDDHLPPLPALRAVKLGYPSDLVGYFRGFARSTLASRIERLGVYVSKPGAGRALVEGRYERLTSLDIGFDISVGAEYLQSARVLGSEAFPAVTDLRLDPPRHLPVLVGTPLGEQITHLRTSTNRDREARELLDHVTRLPRLERLTIEGERRLSPEVLTELLSLDLDVRWPPRDLGTGA